MSSNPTHGEILDTTLCDKVCQWLVKGQWFSAGNKADGHDITEILLKVVLNAINLILHKTTLQTLIKVYKENLAGHLHS